MNPTLSFWEKESLTKKVDFLIIGGGLTGLSTGIELLKSNQNKVVAILELNNFGTNASSKNAGFLCLGSPSELAKDIDLMGSKAVFKLFAWKWAGIQKLLKLTGKKVSQFKNFGGFDLFDSSLEDSFKKTINKLDELNLMAKEITGIENFYEIKYKKLKDLGFKNFNHLIKINFEGQIQPFNTLKHLQLKFQNLGGTFLPNTKVIQFEKTNNEIQVWTNQGLKFKTNKLIFCTNAFTSELIPELKITPGRGQIIITKPLPSPPFKGNFHFDAGYYYFRNYKNRVLLGGARNLDFEKESTTKIKNTDIITNHLENFLKERILPNHKIEIDQKWSGIMGFTENHQPIIKQVEENIFYAVGLNGMGVAMAAHVGWMLAKMINKH